MNIYFDVDYTLIAMDGSLRPGTTEVFEELINDGHSIYIWSGVGMRTDDIERLGLSKFVSDIFVKPITEYEVGLKRFSVAPRPDFVIDDHREIVDAFGGVHIEPYYFRSAEDGHMPELYKAIKDFISTGTSNHRGFKPVSEKK